MPSLTSRPRNWCVARAQAMLQALQATLALPSTLPLQALQAALQAMLQALQALQATLALQLTLALQVLQRMQRQQRLQRMQRLCRQQELQRLCRQHPRDRCVARAPQQGGHHRVSGTGRDRAGAHRCARHARGLVHETLTTRCACATCTTTSTPGRPAGLPRNRVSHWRHNETVIILRRHVMPWGGVGDHDHAILLVA